MLWTERVRVRWYSGTLLVLCCMVLGCFPARAGEGDELDAAKAANRRGDFAAAAAIYRQLESRGLPSGSRGLGLLFWAGSGVPRDHGRACDAFAKAESLGDPMSTELLGDCFHNGDGRPVDYRRSAQL